MRICNLLIFAYLTISLYSCKAGRSADHNKTAPDSSFHLYLLAGQSNMAGRGITDSVSTVINSRILVLNKNNEWVPATDPLHFDKKVAGVGPGISFAKSMLEDMKDDRVKIGLIPCAVGGTSIIKWQPGAFDEKTNTHPYDDALLRASEAMQTGVLKGILWHQGESDSSPEKRIGYLEKLAELITRFRKDLNASQVPVITGEIGYFTDDKKAFNKMLSGITLKVSNIRLISAEGLTANSDTIHFNTASARELGKRYASAMKDLSASR